MKWLGLKQRNQKQRNQTKNLNFYNNIYSKKYIKNFKNAFLFKIISLLYYIKMVEIQEENLDNIINNEEEAEPIKRSRGRPKK